MEELSISKLHELYLQDKDDSILNCIYYQALKLGYTAKRKLMSKGCMILLSNEEIESICGYMLTRGLELYKGESTTFITYLYAGIYKKMINENKKATNYSNRISLTYDDTVKDISYVNTDIFESNLYDVINDNVDDNRARTKQILNLIVMGYEREQIAIMLGITKQYVYKALKKEKDNKELYYNLKYN